MGASGGLFAALSRPARARPVDRRLVDFGLRAEHLLGFFDRLKGRLAMDTRCVGLVVAEYDGPNSPEGPEASSVAAKPHWALLVDYVPGRPSQDWSLQRGGAFMSGTGEPETIAANVCAMTAGSGAETAK